MATTVRPTASPEPVSCASHTGTTSSSSARAPTPLASAVSAVRTLMGPTNPITAPPGSIRGDFGLEIEKNLVHGSDSADSAEREIKIWFQG